MSTSGVSKVYHRFENMELDDGLCGVPHCRKTATEFCYGCVKNLCAEHALQSMLVVCSRCSNSYCVTSVPEGIECIKKHDCWTEEDTYQVDDAFEDMSQVDEAFLDLLDKLEREHELKKQAEQYIDIESSVDDDMELSEHKKEDYGDLDGFITSSDDGI